MSKNEFFEEKVIIVDVNKTPVTAIPVHAAKTNRETNVYRPLEQKARPWERSIYN